MSPLTTPHSPDSHLDNQETNTSVRDISLEVKLIMNAVLNWNREEMDRKDPFSVLSLAGYDDEEGDWEHTGEIYTVERLWQMWITERDQRRNGIEAEVEVVE
jgi:hypothetical protein